MSEVGKKEWMVLDGKGRPIAVGRKSAVLREAADYADETGGIAVIEEPSSPHTEPNPTGDGGLQAYKLSGLDDICRKLYGVDHLTADLVESISIEEAWERVRNYLPSPRGDKAAGRYQKSAWGFLGSDVVCASNTQYGMFGKNAKLGKGDSPDGRPALAFGLSLAPHQVAFRGFGKPSSRGWVLPANINLPKNIEALFSDQFTRTGEVIGDIAGVEIGKTKKYTVCFRATNECRAACLVHSGQNPASDEALISKLALTAALYHDPLAFCRLLLCNLRNYFSGGSWYDLYCRLNVFSDIPWEILFPCLFDPYKMLAFRAPDQKGKKGARYNNWRERPIVGKGSFYDYTKVPFRIRRYAKSVAKEHGVSYNEALSKCRAMYHLTFSYSGSKANVTEATQTIKQGDNVAMVFVREYEESGPEGEFFGAGVPVVGLTSELVKSRFSPFPKDGQALVTQLWEYARSGKRSGPKQKLGKWLKKHSIDYPSSELKNARERWSAGLIQMVLGRPIDLADLYIDPSDKSPENLRYIFKTEWLYPFTFQSGPFKGVPIINADRNDLRAKDVHLVAEGGALVGLDFKVPKIKVKEAGAEKGKLKAGRLDVAKNAFVTGVRERDGHFVIVQTPPQTMDGSQVGVK